MKLIEIIVLLMTIALITGCQEQPEVEYQLPDRVEHHDLGILESISPKELVDSLNAGAKLQMYFLEQTQPTDPAHVVTLPGMQIIALGEMFYISETLDREQTLYLLSPYGNDSRKMGDEMRKKGFHCIYLDGGTFRLYQEMQNNNLKIKTFTTTAPQP